MSVRTLVLVLPLLTLTGCGQEEQSPEPVLIHAMGNAQGYLACGCEDTEMGGLGRVGAHLYREHGAPVEGQPPDWILLDAGDGLVGHDFLGLQRAPFAAEILALLRPAVVNVGAGDLESAGEVIRKHAADLPLVAAGLAEAEDWTPPPAWRLITAGHLRLGVIGLGAGVEGEERARALAREAALAARAAGAQVLILLAALPVDQARAAAEAAGGVAVILVARQSRSLTAEAGAGGPLVVCGVNAEHLCRLELDPVSGALLEVSWVPMDHSLQQHRPLAIRTIVTRQEEDSTRLREEYALLRAGLANQDLPDPYTGSKVCEQCHGEIDGPYDRWIDREKHFAAFRPFRNLHPEGNRCVACHTVGFRELPPLDAGGEPRLVWFEDGVGCEACHGPGTAHVEAAVQGEDPPGHIHRGSVLTAREEICALCHDPEQSPRFDYLRYLRGIRHWDPALETPLREGEVQVLPGPPERTDTPPWAR